MEVRDRKKILENMDKLVEGISSFNSLFESLKNKKMFNSYMENEIQNTEDTKKLEFLFWYVTTRGPEAFTKLCEALREVDHSDLADLLINYSPFSGSVRPFWDNDSDELSLEEEYPDDEEWKVILGKPGEDEFDHDKKNVYRMRSSPRGLALVININSFVNNTKDERVGSEKDVLRLNSILKQLDYVVEVKEDLKAKEIYEAVKSFSKKNEHYHNDSVILVVMSHGQQDDKENETNSNTVRIFGSDSRWVHSQDLVDLLTARKCDALRGKPKMIFFQACRGEHFNHQVTVGRSISEEDQNALNVANANGHSTDVSEVLLNNSVQTDGVMLGKTCMVRSDSDILIAHSTSPGKLSLRDSSGSLYIQTLCRVFAKHAWHEDLHSMLQIVDRTIENMDRCLKQTPPFYNLLLKKVYFQPGINK